VEAAGADVAAVLETVAVPLEEDCPPIALAAEPATSRAATTREGNLVAFPIVFTFSTANHG
jgi:hypothetical protein